MGGAYVPKIEKVTPEEIVEVDTDFTLDNVYHTNVHHHDVLHHDVDEHEFYNVNAGFQSTEEHYDAGVWPGTTPAVKPVTKPVVPVTRPVVPVTRPVVPVVPVTRPVVPVVPVTKPVVEVIEIDIPVSAPTEVVFAHCNPHTNVMQICPSGHLCDNKKLECISDLRGIEYCICPRQPLAIAQVPPSLAVPSTTVHCDPKSKVPQVCPNGHLCNPLRLQCFSDYCVCPFHHRQVDFVDHVDHITIPSVEIDIIHKTETKNVTVVEEVVEDVHCNPNSKFAQFCPSGHLCSAKILKCEVDEFHGLLYCICPQYKVENEVHCNPNTLVPQVCPHGHMCTRSLECNDDYCVCPNALH